LESKAKITMEKNRVFNEVRGFFSLQRERLLVIEDEQSLRDFFFKLLSRRGYRVSLAANIEESAALLSQQTFDLVLHDIVLPDGNGIDSLQRIKAIWPELPVIMLTGLGYDEACFKAALENRASAYLSKFLPFDQVLIEIQRVLKSAKKGERAVFSGVMCDVTTAQRSLELRRSLDGGA
jgi:DNA-binding response OmpR family regulator